MVERFDLPVRSKDCPRIQVDIGNKSGAGVPVVRPSKPIDLCTDDKVAEDVHLCSAGSQKWLLV